MFGTILKIDGLSARIQQIRFRKRSSFPFITGDNFSILADFLYVSDPSTRTSLEKMSNSKVFFCESSLLRDFLVQTEEIGKDSILIVGNGDEEYYDSNIFPEKFSTILLQNSFISDNRRIFTLPLGLENLRIGVNGIPSRFKFDTQERDKDWELLVGPFGETSGERILLNELDDLPGIQVERPRDRVRSSMYPKLLRRSTWIACPRGNGVDTHRVWESLYVGSKPIVIDNPWSRSLRAFGYPLLLSKDWSSNSISLAIKSDPYPDLDPNNFPPLWMNFWKDWLSQLTNY